MQSTSDINNKVSVKQLILIIIVMTVSPTVRFVPGFAARAAAEAGWVTPIAAIPPILVNIYFIQKIFSKYPENSALDIIKDILGKYVGAAALMLHFIWILLLTAFFVRHNAERLVSSIYPNIDINFFIITTLAVVAYIIRSGVTAIARMGEILFPILFIVIAFIMFLLLANIRTDALLPVSLSDVVPVIKGSASTLADFCFLFVIFLFSDNIVGKQYISRFFTRGSFVLLIMIFMVLFTTFGILGHTVASRTPIPFLVTVKQITIADTIENVESVVVALWMLSDAMLISATSIIYLNIAKGLFKLSDTRNFINIFFVLMFVLASSIASNRVELDVMANTVVVYTNVAIGFGTPAFLFIVGKLRRKI